MGQGPRPDLMFEEMQEREERRKLQERKRYENSHPVQPQGLHQDLNQALQQDPNQTLQQDLNQALQQDPNQTLQQGLNQALNQDPHGDQAVHQASNPDQERSFSNGPAVWNGEDSFASRVEDIPKPTKKDLLAMIIAMLELMLPIALLFVAIFGVVLFLLIKLWLHG